jgi:arabinofuranosyltransferase
VVTLGSIGIPAYQLGTDVWVVDIGGLAEPLAARTDIVPGRPAGHRKQVDAAWYTARFGVPAADDEAAQDAARALECGPVEGLLDSVSEPLTPGRFLSNMWHSVGYTRLRIPADPSEAAEEFC